MVKLIYNKHYIKLISKLKEARVEKLFTQTEISKFLGKPQSFVSKYENFEIKIDLEILAKLGFILNIDDTKLYKEFSKAIKEELKKMPPHKAKTSSTDK
ncbi:MAG: helix-turn-helix transcriptional regulator [Alphaproteobacteria bacterium]|nr:helix-turn-helix transcriptional regulator [Alphaproteobacteria bacterium]